MKIQMTRGCIANSLTIDGREEIDLSDNERQGVLLKGQSLRFKTPFRHLQNN